MEVKNNVKNLVANAYEARMKLLAALEATIERVSKLDKAEKISSHTGSGLVLAGSAASVGGGITLMVVTGGLAATVVVPAMLWGGTAVGVGGGLTKIAGTMVCQSKVKTAIEDLVRLAKEDAEANDALMMLEGILEGCQLNFAERFGKHSPSIDSFIKKCEEIGNVRDFWQLIDKVLPPLQSILKKGLPVGPTKDQDNQIKQLLLGAIICGGEKLLKNTSAPASAPASVTASASASSTVATTVTSTSSDDAAVMVVKGTAAGGARTAALVTGGVVIGVGVLVAGWEIFQIVKKAKEKCKIADELREIAMQLQDGIPAPLPQLRGK